MVNALVMPITYTSFYIQRFWGDSTASGSSIRRLRDELADEFGLFKFDKHKPGECNRRATYRDIDIPKMLLVYEQMEKTWIARNGFETLPDHKGGFCKMLYDAVFKRSPGMNRQHNGMPLTEAEATTMRAERRMATQMRHEDELRALRESEYEFRKQHMNVTHPDIWHRLSARIRYLQEWFDHQRSQPIPDLPY